MGLFERLKGVAAAFPAEMRRGAPPDQALANATRRAVVEVGREVVQSENIRAGASGAVLGVTVAETVRRLREDDVDGALDGLASGAEAARRLWMAGRK